MTDQEWYESLPAESISQKALDSLPEYSISIPTYAAPGKVWKQDLRWGRGKPPLWVICEFVDHPTDPAMLKVQKRRPVIKT
jgi:hypothetical protein